VVLCLSSLFEAKILSMSNKRLLQSDVVLLDVVAFVVKLKLLPSATDWGYRFFSKLAALQFPEYYTCTHGSIQSSNN
jgi:hypothetical protein